MSILAPLDPVLTTEAARILEVAPETIRHWERVGILPALKTERGVRLFSRRDCERLRDEREAQRAAIAKPVSVEGV
jgi:DNA-binding transcriptional MerR regulator